MNTVLLYLRALSIAGATSVLTGCSTFSLRIPFEPHSRLDQIEHEKGPIQIFHTAPATGYHALGSVHTHLRWNWICAWWAPFAWNPEARLKAEARALGADAIIDMRKEQFHQFEWTDTHYSGTAVVIDSAEAFSNTGR
jgi:hypothetical protein